MVGTGQEMVRGKKFFKVREMSGILFRVMDFEEFKSEKTEIVRLISCHQRMEETFWVKWVQRTAVIGG